MRFATFFMACAMASGAGAGVVSVTVLDKEGKPVQDAVVVVVPSAKGTPKTALPMTATINQEKMRFIPALTLVPVGAKVTFTNSDPWEHHTRGSAAGLAQFSSTGGGFELRLDGKVDGKPAKSVDVTLDKAGAVLLGCHIHGSMRGHVYVSDSPWAQRTTPEGQAVFDDVPDGTAQVRVWQGDQIIDLPMQTVTVGATPARAIVQLQVVPRRRR
jgi:plastocyanin